MRRFRILASALAVGGVVWGLFCLPFFIIGDISRSLMLFGPGYLITIGYICRTFWTPISEWRRMIWGTSAIVQGAWLTWVLIEATKRGLRGIAFEYISLGWWAFAFLASLYGVVRDVDEPGKRLPAEREPSSRERS
jgi:hypothetical protein